MGTISRVSIHACVRSIDRRRRARRRGVLCLVYGDERAGARADAGHGQSGPGGSAALGARAGKACGVPKRNRLPRTTSPPPPSRSRRPRRRSPSSRRTSPQASKRSRRPWTTSLPSSSRSRLAAEAKPAIAQDKPAAVEEKSAATDDKPAIVEPKPAVPDAKPAVVEQKPAPASGKASGCAREARLEAEVCRQAIRRRRPEQRGEAR